MGAAKRLGIKTSSNIKPDTKKILLPSAPDYKYGDKWRLALFPRK